MCTHWCMKSLNPCKEMALIRFKSVDGHKVRSIDRTVTDVFAGKTAWTKTYDNPMQSFITLRKPSAGRIYASAWRHTSRRYISKLRSASVIRLQTDYFSIKLASLHHYYLWWSVVKPRSQAPQALPRHGHGNRNVPRTTLDPVPYCRELTDCTIHAVRTFNCLRTSFLTPSEL